MDNLEMLKLMAAREAYVLPSKNPPRGLVWFNLMSSSPLISNHLNFSSFGDDHGKTTNKSAEEVHGGAVKEDR